MLAKALNDVFSPLIRSHGENYFNMNRAYLVSQNENTVCFTVSGTKNYQCLFKQKESSQKSKTGLSRSLHMSCECPYFRDYDYCKHLWACIKEGDSREIWGDFLKLKKKNEQEQKQEQEQEQEQKPRSNPQQQKSWKKKIDQLSTQNTLYKASRRKSGHFKVYYALDYYSYKSTGLVVHFYRLENRLAGHPNFIERKAIKPDDFEKLSDPMDSELILLLTSQVNSAVYWNQVYSHGIIRPYLQNQTLDKLCKTGRLFLESGHRTYDIDRLRFLRFNGNEAGIMTHLSLKNSKVSFKTQLEAGNKRIPIEDLIVFWDHGSYITRETVGCFKPEHFDWLKTLKELGNEYIHKSDKDFLVQELFNQEIDTDIELAANMDWKFKEETAPKPKIILKEEKRSETKKELYGKVLFKYGHSEASSLSFQKHSVDEKNRILHLRDFDRESEFLSETESMDFSPTPMKFAQSYNFRIRKGQFVNTIKEMIDKNWEVEAQGKKVESALSTSFSVTSGIDWFDLESEVTFESGQKLTLPELIKSLKRGETLIPLGNGQYGMLPEEWLKKYSSLAEIGDNQGTGQLRFSKVQGIFLDGWFSEEKNFMTDRGFKDFQKNIRKTSLKEKSKPAKVFKGQLRDYQEEGLAWLEYLEKLRFGGVLADDMGLGKTIQVIALLQKKRKERSLKKSHLIVVPKSLVFNWKDEFKRFAPELSVLTYVNKERKDFLKNINQYDVTVTTYQTLRVDFREFRDIEFDYMILDEAQYIKNPRSQVSQVCKMMNAPNKLALTGTPIENSLADLFSILDFLNPGLISKQLKDTFSGVNDLDSDNLKKLSKALSPMILRRTKMDVLKDLPDKIENTIKCKLSKTEQKHYNSLKNYYQLKLSKKIQESGFNQSKIEILEALLRLRQAACHPGLIDKRRINEKSSKLDVLFEQIHSLASSGNKCLVFSQFTSFLKVIRPKLEREKINHLYLDGKTEKRKELVEKFEQSDDFKVFLISLKAGGVGLNLTSANYVFILDPWWNPATETQAIDRTHRIGQKNNVFAYKLIAKDTVEEKILELQKTKKALSEVVINSSSGILKKMNVNDLNFLLS